MRGKRNEEREKSVARTISPSGVEVGPAIIGRRALSAAVLFSAFLFPTFSATPSRVISCYLREGSLA
jgi:hypothetical protein